MVLVLEYDGGCYNGFQFQKAQSTIQGEIEEALKKLTGDSIRVIAASRTDSGVHAYRQVISFKTKSNLEKRAFIDGLNYYLPDDIAVREVYKTGSSFRVRSWATSREYRYYILNRVTRSPLWNAYSYLVKGILDLEAMNLAAKSLLGEHDLVSFASNLGVVLKSTIRCVYRSEFIRDSDFVIFSIKANSFLPHQVRNTVGSLIQVGLGKMNIEEFNAIIKARKIGIAGPGAPARGLFLVNVKYKRELEEYDIENL
ncbi:MAG: tRNA pseudouridine(38-40) synthase TruA [Dehalococcoidia bacterium]|nr:MAG: tRNA pseudouridine(38-40) synthase TruA [Dehalococcoidia bacterium]